MKKYFSIFLFLFFGGLYVHLIGMIEVEPVTLEGFLITIFMLVIASVYIGTLSNMIKVPATCYQIHGSKFIKHILGLVSGFAVIIAGIIVSSLQADNALVFVGFLISLGGLFITIEFGEMVGSTFERMRAQ